MKNVFYVSTKGDDANAGSASAPFATVEKAWKAARAAGTGAKVILKGGDYRIAKTLKFGAKDSGVTFEAAAGKDVTVSGGRDVSGWKKGADGIWFARVPWVTSRGKGFRMLSVNGELRPRSRLPKRDYFTACELKCAEGEDWMKFYYNTERSRFEIKKGDIDPNWDLSNGEVIMYHIWVDSHVIPSSVTEEDGKTWLNLDVPLRRCPSDSIYRIENLREIISEPGEWALDYAKKTVYYLPKKGEDMAKVKVTVPCLSKLVEIDGASDVVFKGIRFADSQFELARGDRNDGQASATISAAVSLTDAEGCLFDHCRFERIGAYAVEMLHGTRDCKLAHCAMTRLGGGGVRLNCEVKRFSADMDKMHDTCIYDPRRRTYGNEISDCEIGDFGLDFPSACGVLLMNAEKTSVVHNHIHDGYYTGVSCGWVWGHMPSVSRDNDISFNHIHDIGKGLLSDMGGIYTLGVSPGTRMCNNLIHDIDARYYGGWGLYNDEGSSHILVENNIVYNTKFSGYHMHFGREVVVRNNIFGGGKIDQLARSRKQSHISLYFYNNIVYWTEGALHSGNWNDTEDYVFEYFPGRTRELRKTTECDWNVYFNPGLKLKDARFGPDLTWEQWRERCEDGHSVWADPLFADAAGHDYTLAENSPAFKLGFRPIDMSTVGPR